MAFTALCCALIVGCGNSVTPEQQAEYDRIKQSCIDMKIKERNSYGSNEYELDNPSAYLANQKANWLERDSAVKAATDLPASEKYKCDQIRQTISIPKRNEVAEAWADAEKSNKELDAAQEEMMADLKKKAVRHNRLPAGAGAKVESFEMRDGSVITCKTTVTNAGRAIDCSN